MGEIEDMKAYRKIVDHAFWGKGNMAKIPVQEMMDDLTNRRLDALEAAGGTLDNKVLGALDIIGRLATLEKTVETIQTMVGETTDRLKALEAKDDKD